MSCGFVRGYDTRHPLIGFVKVAPVDSNFTPFQEHYHLQTLSRFEVHTQSFPRSNETVTIESTDGFAFHKAENDGFRS